MIRKIVFKRNTDPDCINLISRGATEVKPMFGRKAFALEIREIRDEPKTKKQEQRQ